MGRVTEMYVYVGLRRKRRNMSRMNSMIRAMPDRAPIILFTSHMF